MIGTALKVKKLLRDGEDAERVLFGMIPSFCGLREPENAVGSIGAIWGAVLCLGQCLSNTNECQSHWDHGNLTPEAPSSLGPQGACEFALLSSF